VATDIFVVVFSFFLVSFLVGLPFIPSRLASINWYGWLFFWPGLCVDKMIIEKVKIEVGSKERRGHVGDDALEIDLWELKKNDVRIRRKLSDVAYFG